VITFVVSGSTQRMEKFLKTVSKLDILAILDSYAIEGAAALALATPVHSGLAASSWGFDIGKKGDVYFIAWTNSDIESGFPVAIMLQYGYSTGTGGYVAGVDYINPAIRPIFDQIADKVWKAVTSA
jgi:hypothetical protein